jgi:MFS transporter, ACS family, hexuronate transporter
MEKETALAEAQPYRWVILALTALTFLLTFVARFTWPPLIPVVVPLLGMKMSQAGAYMSAFYIGYVITQIPAGILADKFGVRMILASSLILEGLTTFGMGYIGSYEAGFGLRVATGLGAGAVFSACARALMEWIPPKERGTAFGVLLAAPSAGILLSGWLVPPLQNAFGWQGAFQSVGGFTVCIGIVLFFLIRSSNEAKSTDSIMDGFRVVFGSKDLILTAMAGFCLMWLELGTATWTFAYVKQLGFTRAAAGGILVVYGLGGLLAPMLSGILSDKIGHRKYILIISLALVIPVTILFGHQKSIAMLSVVGFFFGFCSYLSNPHLTVMISEFAGKKWAATANGTSNFIFQMAPIIAPVVMGWSIDVTGAFASVWWIMAAGPVLGILLLLPVNPENKKD